MRSHLVQQWIVPAPAQVIALEIVRCIDGPAGLEFALVVLVDVDENLLPVGLVVVRSVKLDRRIVHRHEEQVLQHNPAVVPDNSSVV